MINSISIDINTSFNNSDVLSMNWFDELMHSFINCLYFKMSTQNTPILQMNYQTEWK